MVGEDEVAEALKRHFPDAPADQLLDWSSKVLDRFQASEYIQTLDRADRGPEKDRLALERAEKHLRQAAKALDGAGWHAGKALRAAATNYAKADGIEWYPRSQIRTATDIVIQHFARAGDLVADAVSRLPEEAPPLLDSMLGEEGKRRSAGRRYEIVGELTARDCLELYEDVTGKRPARRTSVDKGEAYGPIFDLVSDIFQTLGVTASVESSIRKAINSYGENRLKSDN